VTRRSALALVLLGCGPRRATLLPEPLPPEVYAESAPSAGTTASGVTISVGRDDPRVGDPRAPATLVVFSDLQCPFCADFHEALAEIYPRHRRELRIVFKHHPLPVHRHARAAAELAVAVREAHGEVAFWRFVDAAFRILPAGGSPDQALAALQLDEAPVRAALASGSPARKVDEDMKLGDQLGVTGTPTSFLNGQGIHGAVDAVSLDAMVAAATNP
jgi:protein-disulfide isomerase